MPSAHFLILGYEITVAIPGEENTTERIEGKVYRAIDKREKNRYLIGQEAIKWHFDDSDTTGTYTIEATAVDKRLGETLRLKKSFRYED